MNRDGCDLFVANIDRPCTYLHILHRKELLKQWVERLRQFLSVNVDDIGTIGGGRRKPTGRALAKSRFSAGTVRWRVIMV